MIRLIGFIFDNPLGRAAVAALGLVALVSAFAAHQRSIGAGKAVAGINRQGEEKRGQADEVRRAVRRPGAAAGVLKQYCRDC